MDALRGVSRNELNAALARAIAYKQCGKDALATEHAKMLVAMLRDAGLL